MQRRVAGGWRSPKRWPKMHPPLDPKTPHPKTLPKAHLDQEMEGRVVEATGNVCFWLGGTDLDEDSEATDPEQELREEVAALKREAEDRQSFLVAIQGALAQNSLVQNADRRPSQPARAAFRADRHVMTVSPSTGERTSFPTRRGAARAAHLTNQRFVGQRRSWQCAICLNGVIRRRGPSSFKCV